MWAFLRGSAFALKSDVFFSVSSLELGPVVFVQPLIYPYWELRWSLLRNEMPSPATMSCISGHSPYMICEVWVPRSSMASSVLELSTISVSKTSPPAGSHACPLPTCSIERAYLRNSYSIAQFVLVSLTTTVLGIKIPVMRWFIT